MNQYESEIITELLISNGYNCSPNKSTADISIINSCTVTAVSDSKALKQMRKLRRENPGGIIVLTGCLPQAFPEDSDAFSEADIILGNSCRGDIIRALEMYMQNPSRIVMISERGKEGVFEDMAVRNFNERTRAFIKIEDGCNRFCSYCIILYARGRVCSKKTEDIKKEVEALAQKGFKEIVLVGINLSAYGQDIDADIFDAVKAVCDTDGIARVRLGSLEPERMDADLIAKLKREEKFCPSFHLSLQSGCDATLKRMNRHYTSDEYSAIVGNIRKSFPDAAITTDIMVGFAGESDEEFAESLAFAQKTGFAKVHVFPYSLRKGTRAYEFKDQISNEIKNKRAKIMQKAANRSRTEFLNSLAGSVLDVLFEQRNRKGYYEGYTKNYMPVWLKTREDIRGRIINVKITGFEDDHLLCEADI